LFRNFFRSTAIILAYSIIGQNLVCIV